MPYLNYKMQGEFTVKKDISKIVFVAVCAVLICTIGFCLGRFTYKLNNTEKTHYCLVKPIVYDAYTGEPLANATVINTADGKAYTTDSSGSTDWIAVYYSENEETKLCTFIARTDGYKTTLLYMVCETGTEPLDGPMIYMFEGASKSDIVSMVYSPSDEYAQELTRRFVQMP